MTDLPPDDPWSTPLPLDTAASATTAEETTVGDWTPITPIPDDVPGAFPRHRLGRPAAWWVYKNAAGHRLFIVCRFDLADGGKDILPLTYNQQADGRRDWRWKGLPTPRPLYGLDRLAARPAAALLICEGEKAAEAAALLFPDRVAVTSPNGANAADKADWSPLAGRVVTIWPDHDAEGRAYAADVARLALAAGALLVTVVTVPATFPDKWDLADTIPEGWMDTDLRRLVDEAAPMSPTITPSSTDWPDPLPLAKKVEAEPYPLDALPGAVRFAVEEVRAFIKAPVPLVAASALGAMSLAIQAHVDVKRADRLTGPVGLFLLAIADSGERKSTCDSFFSSAIRDYQAEQEEAAKPVQEKYRADISAWEAKRAATVDAIKTLAKAGKETSAKEEALRGLEANRPEAPRIPKLLRGDDTPENLAWTLAKGWPSAGVVSSEAGIIFGSHGMGKESVMRNLSLLNILWDGGALDIGRRTSDSFKVQGARLTIGLQVQAATVRDFFDRAGDLARGTGFLARFLVSWPESTQGLRPFTEAPESWPALAAFNRRTAAILSIPAPIDENGSLTPAMLTFSTEAKSAWVAYHDAIESQLASGGELYDVRDVASKSADNAARLSALFHLFEHGPVGVIGPDAFESAARIVAWHLNESRRFLGELTTPPDMANAAALDRWLIDYCRKERTDSVPTRAVLQYGPRCLRSQSALDAALNDLDGLGRARLEREGKRKAVLVNPALIAERGLA